MKFSIKQINDTLKLSRAVTWLTITLFFILIYFVLFNFFSLNSILYDSRTQKNILVDSVQNEDQPNNIIIEDNSLRIFTPAHISDQEEMGKIAKLYPNIPLEFWLRVKKDQNNMKLNDSCAPFPNIFKVNINNVYWQMIHMTNKTSIQVYSAYYDKRKITGRMVRILSMVNRTKYNFPGKRTLHCQLWFDNETKPVLAPMNEHHYMWLDEWKSHVDGAYAPYLLGCAIPKSHINKVPRVVSFVENPCDTATTMLRVVYDEAESQSGISVCVKGLDFLQTDLSFRLVEWIELIFLLGADKISFYEFGVHHNMQKVLDYYQRLGKIDVRPTKLPSGHPSIPFLEHIFMKDNNVAQCLDELIPYNDCFYRNLYSHKYVALLDIDEVIMPLKDNTWQDLIKRGVESVEPNIPINSFTVQHIYFLDRMDPETPHKGIPSYMHMMQHIYRAQNFTPWDFFIKTLFSTEETITCHNHWPISVASGSITYSFSYEDAQMQHYRQDCSWEVNCDDYLKNPIRDTRMWDFKDILVPRVKKAIKEIGLLKGRSRHHKKT